MGDSGGKNIIVGIAIGLVVMILMSLSYFSGKSSDINQQLLLKKAQLEAEEKARKNLQANESEEIFNYRPQYQGGFSSTFSNPSEKSSDSSGTSSNTVTVIVGFSDNPRSIARKLLDAGLIIDEDSFLLRIRELGLDKSIKIGTYRIPAGTDMLTLIELITK